MSRGVRGWVCLAALTAVIAGGVGCMDGTSSTQPEPTPVVDAPGPVASTDADTAVMFSSSSPVAIAEMASKVEAVAGGIVTNGVVTVLIPPGALAGDDSVRIVMAPGKRMVFDISVGQPLHDRFLHPVRVQVNLTGISGATQPALYWMNPADSTWYGLTASSYDTTTHVLSAPLGHFSHYGAGSKAGW